MLPKHVIEDRAHPRHRERLASVGYPQPMVELSIRAPDGTRLPTGEAGEVCVRGEVVMKGAKGDPLLVLQREGKGQVFDSLTTCVAHGDLHADNFFVDSTHMTWLIDFEHTGRTHALRDFVELEADIKLRLSAYPDDDLGGLAALERGLHVVTANKGPLAYAYRELSALARAGGVGFFFESTVMDGAPVHAFGREGLPVSEIRRISGVLNSTTNSILTRLEQGVPFAEALQEMQAAGLAEADWATWAAVLWQSIGNTIFGYGVWAWLLARYPAATVAPFSILVPVFGIGASALLMGEALPPWKLLAAGLVMAGLAPAMYIRPPAALISSTAIWTAYLKFSPNSA